MGLTDSGGGAYGNTAALTRRIARAQKLPAVVATSDLARALKLHADAYAKAAAPPKYEDIGPPYDGGFITVSTFPAIDPEKYTVLKCEQKLVTLIAEGAVWAALRRFVDPVT